MAFFEGLKRLIQGKPVFTVEDQATGQQPTVDQPQPMPQQSMSSEQQQGPEIVPEVIIDEYEVHPNGARMMVEFSIKNHSAVQVELDKIRLLKTHKELDHPLRPGEERQFVVYDGPIPTDPYEDKIQLEYKNPNGNYFSAQHRIEFQQQADKTYIIHRVRFEPPIRDI